MPKGSLVGLSSADLTSIKSSCVACLVANTVRGFNYTIAGRSFTFPDLAACQDVLSEANYAFSILAGTRSSNVRANFNPSLGRGTA